MSIYAYQRIGIRSKGQVLSTHQKSSSHYYTYIQLSIQYTTQVSNVHQEKSSQF